MDARLTNELMIEVLPTLGLPMKIILDLFLPARTLGDCAPFLLPGDNLLLTWGSYWSMILYKFISMVLSDLLETMLF